MPLTLSLEGSGWGGGVSSVAPVFTHRLVRLVEHDGLRVLVHHLSHVSQDVLLGDDAQETPEEKKNRSEVPHPAGLSLYRHRQTLKCYFADSSTFPLS